MLTQLSVKRMVGRADEQLRRESTSGAVGSSTTRTTDFITFELPEAIDSLGRAVEVAGVDVLGRGRILMSLHSRSSGQETAESHTR
jgi:hypothetical protein